MLWINLLIFSLLTILAILIITVIYGAPWFPTTKDIDHKMLSLAKVKPGEVVFDLGSGDGRIIMMAAKEFGANSVGIDMNPFWVLWTKAKITFSHLGDKVRVIWGNFFNQDLSKADVITLYLLQKTNDRLKPKLEKELRPGTRVVSHVFTFNDWNLVKADQESKIYLYKI